ncbi:MAG: Gfo/Idh/MocA family oxidoreductase [Gemmatimonadaceae bacterium]|nr:Gfo/Idh/MocA family oxidoreductase [Gemmatimonadaceae bacterium]
MTRVAVIGLGGMGRHHAEAVRDEPGCELVGGAEIDAERGRAWGERFGAPVFDDFERLLDETAPDVAVIATQAPLHEAPVLAAAGRGVHVFCEKPIALDLVQADRMVAACRDQGVKLAVNHIKRASPFNGHAREWIEAGRIGRVIRLQAANKGGRRAGNELMEMGTHLYDWLRLFGGDVEWLHGHLTQLDGRESGLADIRLTQEVNPGDRDAGLVLGERAFVSLRFCGGVHADVGFAAEAATDDDNYGIDIVGTEGRIALRRSVGTRMFLHRGAHMAPGDAWEPVPLPEEDLDEAGSPRDRDSKRRFLQRLMLRDLIEAAARDREPLSSGADGRDCLEMIHATYESHRRRARVEMPLTPRQHPLERWRREAAGERGP